MPQFIAEVSSKGNLNVGKENAGRKFRVVAYNTCVLLVPIDEAKGACANPDGKECKYLDAEYIG